MSRRAATIALPVLGTDAHGRPRSGQPDVIRAAAALAPRDGRRLFRSPVFLLGASVTLMIQASVVVEVVWGGTSPDLLWWGFLTATPLMLLLFLLTAATAMREHRHRTEELFGTLPVPNPARTGAMLLSAGWAILAAEAVAIPFLVILVSFRTPPTAEVVTFLEQPLVVALLVAIGVMVGRWVPFLPAGPVAAVFLLFAIGIGAGAGVPKHFFGVWLGNTDSISALGWHAVYLAGLTGLASCLALLRHGPRRPLIAVAVLSLGVALAGGFLQLPDFCRDVGNKAVCVWT